MSLSTIFGARRSLQRGLVLNVILALVICVGLATVVLVREFYEHLDENAEAALRREAKEIAAALDSTEQHLGQDPDALRFRGNEGSYRYTVFDAEWRPLLGGELQDPVPPEEVARLAKAVQSGGMFQVGPNRLGVAIRRDLENGHVVVLATTTSAAAGRSNLGALRHEFEEQAGWVLFGVFTVLAAAILAARRSLRPLREALVQAGGIGPGAPERRLTPDQLPAELLPLIEAVNLAFDRLERGYRAQRDFSSNVAHEVRTPLAVLRSGIEAVNDPEVRAELSEDLSRLDRMFEQLIDLARADAHGQTERSDTDLHRLALDRAIEVGANAIRAGRSLAVTGAERAPARGNPGLLTVALDNLIRNALNHTPKGTEIEIDVQADPPGWRISDRGPGVPDAVKSILFERFRRGANCAGGAVGAGIGLAIVKSVVEAHGGSVAIEDRPGGGAIFVVQLPPAA